MRVTGDIRCLLIPLRRFSCFSSGGSCLGRLSGRIGFSQAFGLFAFFALRTFLAELEALASCIGSFLVACFGLDLALGKPEIIHQRNVAWAHIVTTATFDTVEQLVFFQLFELAGA